MNNEYPLAGLKVLELARVLAGPWAGQVLSDLGAEVIKIEAPQGDETRNWGPLFKQDSSAYFDSTNRGKKSFVADLKNPTDLAIVKQLARQTDILIENFKVGGLKKYKLDFKNLKKSNKKMIYCSITGFGQTGPESHRAGYDFIIQAMGGIMDLTGEPDGDPQKPGVANADLFTGLYSVIAIQSALLSQKQNSKPVYIDMSLFDTQLGVLANQASSYLTTGKSPSRMGNSHPVIVPYQKFDTIDGPIIIACGNDMQFKRFNEAFGWNFHNDSSYKTNRNRVQNRQTLVPLISQRLIKLSKNQILRKLQKVGVPSGPINTVSEALSEKQAVHRQMVLTVDNKPSVRTPILFDRLSLKYTTGSPKLGQHNKEIKMKLKE